MVMSATALWGCSGAEFHVDPIHRDGATDTQIPTNDRNTSDGVGGRDGKGGSGGTGTGGSGHTGGNGGTGAGGSGGTGGNGGTDEDGGPDDGSDDDGTGTNGDALGDNGLADTHDGHADGADGRGGGDTDRSGDVADAPRGDTSPSDAKDGMADTDVRSDASISDTRDSISDVTCSEPVMYYRDQDGDGFGTNDMVTTSCIAPGNGWSTMGGDCRDDLSSVKPFQSGWPNPPQYSGGGYTDPAKPQGISFDYDCTGTETPDPSNAYGPVPNCGGLLNCEGAGYLPLDPARTGPGIDPRCGSTTLQRCNGKLLGNCGLLPPEVTSIPYRCR
jgi:hypothetical protein